jgi:hypothetical protein
MKKNGQTVVDEVLYVINDMIARIQLQSNHRKEYKQTLKFKFRSGHTQQIEKSNHCVLIFV